MPWPHLLGCFCVVISNASLAQAPAIQWQVPLGGNSYDYGEDVQQTSDGGYIVLGETLSNNGDVSGNHGLADIWLVRMDMAGDVVWQECLGGSSGDVGYGLDHTADGGFVVTGMTYSSDGDVSGNNGSGSGWVVKLDPTGIIQWEHAFGGSNYEEFRHIRQTSDGGYIVVGSTYSDDGDVSFYQGSGDIWLLKLDALGGLTWEQTYGGSCIDDGLSVEEVVDGYVVQGSTCSVDGDVVGLHNEYDIWVFKVDDTGSLQWQTPLGGSAMDEGLGLDIAADGGPVIAGSVRSNDGDISGWHSAVDPCFGPIADAWVVKLSGSGVIEWQRSLGGFDADIAWTVRTAPDGGFLVACATHSNDGDVSGNQGDGDVWVVKLDASGALLWQKCLGGSAEEWPNSLALTNDGGCIIAGSSHSSDGDVSSNQGGSDLWAVKLTGPNTGMEDDALESLTIGPIPASTVLHIAVAETRFTEVILAEAMGKEALRAPFKGGQTTLDVAQLPRGLYFLELRGSDSASTRRVVLE